MTERGRERGVRAEFRGGKRDEEKKGEKGYRTEGKLEGDAEQREACTTEKKRARD